MNTLSVGKPDTASESNEGLIDSLLDQVYEELKRTAHYYNQAESQNFTLQTTALVHEAYMRLAGSDQKFLPKDKEHFRALASRIIRRLLVDQARKRNTLKRQPDMSDLEKLRSDQIDPALEVNLLDLESALENLGQHAPRLEQIVEMRFFGGLINEEVADELGLCSRTVERDWLKARAYLLRSLEPPDVS